MASQRRARPQAVAGGNGHKGAALNSSGILADVDFTWDSFLLSRLIPREPKGEHMLRRPSRLQLARYAIGLAAIGLTAIVACTPGGISGGGSRGSPPIVTTTYPVAFITESLTISTATPVIDMTPNGTEPHDIELTSSDMDSMAHAKLVLYVRGGFQPSTERAVASLPAGGPPTYDLLSGLSPMTYGGMPAGSGSIDPHFWTDPVRMAQAVTSTADVISGTDPGNRAKYETAAQGLASKLNGLDNDFRQGLASCKSRTIVTGHAAYGYLAARYDLTQVAISGASPESEPTPSQIEHAAEVARASGTKAVFYEPLSSPKAAQTVAEQAGLPTAVLDPIEGLTPAEAESGADYFTLMKQNLSALRSALDCA